MITGGKTTKAIEPETEPTPKARSRERVKEQHVGVLLK